jgi:hypothetical protein
MRRCASNCRYIIALFTLTLGIRPWTVVGRQI